MANFYRDNEDLRFYVEKGIDWAELVELVEYGYREPSGMADLDEAIESYSDLLDAIGELVAEEVAPRSAAIDRAGVSLVNGEAVTGTEFNEIFDQIRELDLHSLGLPRALGGINAPMLLYFLSVELMSRADVSVMSHFGFHGGVALAMLGFSMKEGSLEYGEEPWQIESCRFSEEIAEIASGRAWGAMDITEPDAGSDMAALRTVAECDESGQWTVTGEKIFITSGHGKYHFVIARTEDAGDSDDPMAGLGGLSMFLVPTYHEENGERVRLATIERVEEKLGHHGSVTAAIRFDRTPAKLIGKRGEGFRYMLMLMNNARIGVGFESIGVYESAFRMASRYASERVSMGKTLDRHEMIADYLDEMEIELIGLRAIAVKAGYHEEVAHRLEMHQRFSETTGRATLANAERRRRYHQRTARRITPVLKYIAAERAVEGARRCVQIHGGNGYMKEYGAEKLLRDAMVLPIYEGTSQIQSLMAMKDALAAIMKEPQAFVRRLAQARWLALSARDPLERRVAKVRVIALTAQQHLITKTASDKFRSLQGRPLGEWPDRFLKNWDPKRDFSFAMLHAERLTRLLADKLICEALLEQARNHPERRVLLERYIDRAEPRCRYLADEISRDRKRPVRANVESDAA